MKTYDAVVFMVPLEDGLTLMHWANIINQFEADAELLPVEVSENNTTMIGLTVNHEDDIRDEIKDALAPIADDWYKEPENSEVTTKNDHTVKILHG